MIDFYLSEFLNVARPVFWPARDHILAKWFRETRATSFRLEMSQAPCITHDFDIYLEMKFLRKLLIFLQNCPTFVLGVFIWSSHKWFPRVFYFSTIPNRSQTNPEPILARFYVLNPNWVRLANDESILHFIIIGGKDFKYVSTFEAP